MNLTFDNENNLLIFNRDNIFNLKISKINNIFILIDRFFIQLDNLYKNNPEKYYEDYLENCRVQIIEKTKDYKFKNEIFNYYNDRLKEILMRTKNVNFNKDMNKINFKLLFLNIYFIKTDKDIFNENNIDQKENIQHFNINTNEELYNEMVKLYDMIDNDNFLDYIHNFFYTINMGYHKLFYNQIKNLFDHMILGKVNYTNYVNVNIDIYNKMYEFILFLFYEYKGFAIFNKNFSKINKSNIISFKNIIDEFANDIKNANILDRNYLINQYYPNIFNNLKKEDLININIICVFYGINTVEFIKIYNFIKYNATDFYEDITIFINEKIENEMNLLYYFKDAITPNFLFIDDFIDENNGLYHNHNNTHNHSIYNIDLSNGFDIILKMICIYYMVSIIQQKYNNNF